ncbi:unnamed protein product [Trichobilharzia regenti]|nr:unnamed protein product [Trichobilharzia regenti]
MDSSDDVIIPSNIILDKNVQHQALYKNYIFVFMIVGLITLIPLIIISIIVLLKGRMSKLCRLLLLCTCLTLGSIVSGLAFIHYTLGPIDLVLAKGDQVLIGEPTNTFFMNRHELRSFTCSHLEIQSSKLRTRVWATPISPHYGAQQNYSLVLRNWSLPTMASLRLHAGDYMHVHNFSQPTQIILLKGEDSLNRWIQSGAYKKGYEKCCSWYTLQTNLEGRQYALIENNDVYTMIIRPSYSTPTTSHDNKQKLQVQSSVITGYIDLSRTRWSPNPCDPIICDGSTTTLCKIPSSPKSYIIDYAVETLTAPDYDYTSVRIICYPRHWILGLMFSSPSIFIISLILIIRLCIKKQQRQLKFSDTSIHRTPFTDLNIKQIEGKYTASSNENYHQPPHHHNAAFEFDLV